MANESIRNDFVEGTYEIFTTLFNEGETDGIKLYLLSDEATPNVYGEMKYKKYKEPVTLVSHARINARHENLQYVEEMKYQWYFVVPLKSLQENELSVSSESLNIYKKGMIEFQGVFYSIDEVLPRIYLEDVFLFYHFVCTEETNVKSLLIEEPKIEEPETPEEPPEEPIEPPEELPPESGDIDG